jgi:hypothetical protein
MIEVPPRAFGRAATCAAKRLQTPDIRPQTKEQKSDDRGRNTEENTKHGILCCFLDDGDFGGGGRKSKVKNQRAKLQSKNQRVKYNT